MDVVLSYLREDEAGPSSPNSALSEYSLTTQDKQEFQSFFHSEKEHSPVPEGVSEEKRNEVIHKLLELKKDNNHYKGTINVETVLLTKQHELMVRIEYLFLKKGGFTLEKLHRIYDDLVRETLTRRGSAKYTTVKTLEKYLSYSYFELSTSKLVKYLQSMCLAPDKFEFDD